MSRWVYFVSVEASAGSRTPEADRIRNSTVIFRAACSRNFALLTKGTLILELDLRQIREFLINHIMPNPVQHDNKSDD